MPTGTTPPSTCKATNTNCTTNAVPAITIVKTATPTTVTKVGQTITYKFVATNTGGTSLTNVSVTDKFTSPPSDKLVDTHQVHPGHNHGHLHLVDNHGQPGHRSARHLRGDLQGHLWGPGQRGDQQLGHRLGELGHTEQPDKDNKGDLAALDGLGGHGRPGDLQDRLTGLGHQRDAGEVLTYTLTFANTKGTAAAPVNYTDNLADVLDDATVTTPPALATGSGLTVGSITTAKGTFTVTGTVPAKTVDTVTYKVTVDAVTKDTTGTTSSTTTWCPPAQHRPGPARRQTPTAPPTRCRPSRSSRPPHRPR